MSAVTKGRRKPAAKLPPKPAKSSAWDRLTALIAKRSALHDSTLRQTNPGIAEAVALIKHAGPERHQVGSLIVAQGLLIGEAISIARTYLCFEEPVVEVVNLLGEHIRHCGLNEDCEGGYSKDRTWPLSLEEGVASFRRQWESGFPNIVVSGPNRRHVEE